MKKTKTFGDYKSDADNWITLATGEFYPDILTDACELYEPVLVMFGQLLKASESSQRLFLLIAEVPTPWMRVQLCRVFKRYVSPCTPVEMLKKKSQAKAITRRYGDDFRPIQEAQSAFLTRPMPDEALCALLWEYKERGQKGYSLTERLFELFQSHFPTLRITGPKRAGKDVLLGTVFDDYPNPKRPVDFIIKDIDSDDVLAVGLARYDSDRGGAQEDDRTGGYNHCAQEFFTYADQNALDTKLIFLNDGPGLLLGSMWDDYATLESRWGGRVKVVTLRMIPERITYQWMKSEA